MFCRGLTHALLQKTISKPCVFFDQRMLLIPSRRKKSAQQTPIYYTSIQFSLNAWKQSVTAPGVVSFVSSFRSGRRLIRKAMHAVKVGDLFFFTRTNALVFVRSFIFVSDKSNQDKCHESGGIRATYRMYNQATISTLQQ